MKREDNTYALDHSAIIHLAARRKNHTNLFRIEMMLKEKVEHKILQKALENIIQRFPSVMAGIQENFLDYRIVPVKEVSVVKKKTSCLYVMSKEEIKKGAFRVLYSENRIAVEFFHSLTDGHGGMVVTTNLVAEYLRLKYGIEIPASGLVLKKEGDILAETEDAYLKFAGEKGAVPRYKSSFQLPEGDELDGIIGMDGKNEMPGAARNTNGVQRTCYEYSVSEMLNLAHDYGVSITTLLVAVMIVSVMEIQKIQPDRKSREQPVQVMVPVDLRRLFGSSTLRNFSLFALCGVKPQKEEISFEQLLKIVESQLNEQTTSKFMQKTIAGQRKATQFPIYKCLPLSVKMQVLRFVQEVWGESNSCISISNLGVVSFPKVMEEQIENVTFTLSPRRKSPYNCSVVSYKGKMSVMFSRRCGKTELENIFSKKLKIIFQKHYVDKFLTKEAYSNIINKDK